MCHAMEAAGLSPYLVPFEGAEGKSTDPIVIQSLIYSVVRSGFAPILLLKNSKHAHAIAVGGMHLTAKPFVGKIGNIKVTEAAGKLKSLYINDDRNGPYQLADLKGNKLSINTLFAPPDIWAITHLMVPLHPKIRLAFSDLYTFSTLTIEAIDFFVALAPEKSKGSPKTLNLEYWIAKSRVYRHHALYGPNRLSSDEARNRLNNEHDFSRYIGIIRVKDRSIGTIDIVVDVTNTNRHMNVWLIMGRDKLTPWGRHLVALLGHRYGARTLVDG
jgi:hypothetical protein